MHMDSRAQATVEYLVMLAALLGIIVIVAIIVTQMAAGQKGAVNESTQALNQSIRGL